MSGLEDNGSGLDLGAKTWVIKYRPRNVDEVILPMRIKKYLLKYAQTGNIESYTAIGKAGSGKTSSALALVEQVGCDYIIINASEVGNIETIRTTVREYATKYSLNEIGYKVIILDEADGLTPNAQNALRGVIEEFQETCRFILTANMSSKIIEALTSRCPPLDFTFSKEEKTEMMKQFFPRIKEILDENKIHYDKKELLLFVDRYFPDFRSILHIISRSSINNSLELKNVGSANDDKINELVGYLKGGNFTAMRKWVAESSDTDASLIRQTLYDKMYEMLSEGIPTLVLILNEYDYKENFVKSKEINTVAMFTAIMNEVVSGEINFK